MKKVARYLFRIIAGILILFLLVCIAAWIYVSYNKASILLTVKKELNSRINGQVSIGDIDASFFQTFPRVSFGLYKITIRDSLWKQHHHDLLQADKVFADLNIFKLFTGRLSVDKIIIDRATAYIFTDSTGYANTNIIRPRQSSSKSSSSAIPSIEIKNSKIFIEKVDKNKFFSFDIDKLNARVKESEPGRPVLFDINLSAFVHTMAFNQRKEVSWKEKQYRGNSKSNLTPALKYLNLKMYASLSIAIHLPSQVNFSWVKCRPHSNFP